MAEKDNVEKYFNDIKTRDDIDIENAKDIMMTASQSLAFHKVVRERLSKEEKLYSKDEYEKLYERYYLSMICLMRTDHIEEYIQKNSKDGG